MNDFGLVTSECSQITEILHSNAWSHITLAAEQAGDPKGAILTAAARPLLERIRDELADLRGVLNQIVADKGKYRELLEAFGAKHDLRSEAKQP
jgi:hypothetical protein